MLCRTELLCVIDTHDGCCARTSLFQIVPLGDIGVKAKVLSFFQRRTRTELVENVVVAFSQRLEHDTRAFEKVGSDSCTNNFLLPIKKNLTGILMTG